MREARRVHEVPPAGVPGDRLVLDYDARQRHRFRARLESGELVAVRLPRGTVLKDGDVLEMDDGVPVAIVAAPEALSIATTSDPLLLARIAYHLGNRHVALQVEPGHLAYLHDHVLDDLCTRLGAAVAFAEAPFTPEGGAYGLGGHYSHSHSHAHDHHDSHSHSESHSDHHDSHSESHTHSEHHHSHSHGHGDHD